MTMETEETSYGATQTARDCLEVDPIGGTTGPSFLIGSLASPILFDHATRGVCCCCCRGGHVGDAAASSKTLCLRARWVVPLCKSVRGLGRRPILSTEGLAMDGDREVFIAFDSAKLKNAVAVAEAGRAGEVRYLGRSPTRRRRSASWSRSLPTSTTSCTSVTRRGPPATGFIGKSSRSAMPAS